MATFAADDADPLYSVLNRTWHEHDVLVGFTKPFSDFYILFHKTSTKVASQVPLSQAQQRSLWMLWHWWTTYQLLCEVSTNAPGTKYIRHMADGRAFELNVDSLYFKRMARLFEREFGGPMIATTKSRLLDMRQEAAKFSACQHVALHCYRHIFERPGIKLGDLNGGDHQVMLKLSSKVLPSDTNTKFVLRNDDLAGLHPHCAIGTTLEPCSWLPNTDGLPFYLWDRSSHKVVLTDQLHTRPAYTAISHTWGRWQKRNEAAVRVEGVPDWLVPQNTLFEVRALPELLVEVPTASQYIWFDLVCIPQDSSPKANEEIARQATIFRNAEHCIVWLNQTRTWTGLEKAIEHMSIVFLNMDLSSHSFADGEATGFFEDYNYAPGILRESITTTGWFSSLWTLQELCLRPDMWLCNANWELFTVGAGPTPVAMDTIVALTQECTLAFNRRAFLANTVESARPLINPTMEQISPSDLFGKLVGLEVYPRGYLELAELFSRTGMSYLHFIRRDIILLLGSNRFCRDLRAEAIMSVIGTTEWSRKRHASSPLVLGQYPLQFVQHVRAEIGPNFFNSISVSDRNLSTLESAPIIEPQGSLMPFQSGTVGCESKFILDWIFEDEVDHPSVTSWMIKESGSVGIPRAGILASTRRPGEHELISNIWLTHESPDDKDPRFNIPGRRFRTVDLSSWIGTYFPFSDNFAVELCRVNSSVVPAQSSSRGILLKEVCRGSRKMLKIGNYVSSTYREFPEGQVVEEQVDWTVL